MSIIEHLEYLKDYYPCEYKGHEKWHKSLKNTKNRENNGKNEEDDINTIIKHLNERSELGLKMIKSLEKDLSIIFQKAIKRNGCNRKTHYDFIIIDQYNKEHQIEHKGSYKYKKIKDDDKPWKNGVQFLNNGAEKFNICKIYAMLWYQEYINSDFLSNIYKLQAKKPTFNTWYKSDCCTQGDPKTLFGIELKKVYREKYGKGSLLNLRKKINNKFVELVNSDKKILEDFENIVIEESNKVLKEKHIWLQINGDINLYKNIDFKWYNGNNFKLEKNNNISLKIKSDIDFQFICTSGFKFFCKLRWGKGCGFSNLRIDFK